VVVAAWAVVLSVAWVGSCSGCGQWRGWHKGDRDAGVGMGASAGMGGAAVAAGTAVHLDSQL
jgi:hypothetical protein